MRRRLIEGAGQEGGSADRIAQRERVARSVPEQCHRLGVAAGLGVHEVRRDLGGGCSALAQDLRCSAVQPLAFGGRQVAVDRRAQDGVRKADGAAGFHHAGGDQGTRCRLDVGVGESGQSRAVSDLRAVSERAEGASERGHVPGQARETE